MATVKTARDLLQLSKRELYGALQTGHAIDPDELDDTEYHGVSLGMPAFVDKLTWKKFIKTFHRDPDTGQLRGWNVRIEQSPLEDPAWEPKLEKGERVTFGHYQVVALAGYRMPVKVPQGLMLDYGLGGNPKGDFTANVRDPLVAVNAGSVELLLGWSYVALGPARMKTPSFFSLERGGALTHRVAPPRKPGS